MNEFVVFRCSLVMRERHILFFLKIFAELIAAAYTLRMHYTFLSFIIVVVVVCGFSSFFSSFLFLIFCRQIHMGYKHSVHTSSSTDKHKWRKKKNIVGKPEIITNPRVVRKLELFKYHWAMCRCFYDFILQTTTQLSATSTSDTSTKKETVFAHSHLLCPFVFHNCSIPWSLVSSCDALFPLILSDNFFFSLFWFLCAHPVVVVVCVAFYFVDDDSVATKPIYFHLSPFNETHLVSAI